MTASAPTLQIPALRAVGNARAVVVILAVSAAIFGFLIWLLYFKGAAGRESPFILALPAVNASLNGLSALLLTGGLIAILRNRPSLHMKLMFAALASSAAFLTFYLIYHAVHGNTIFAKTSPVRPVYLLLLASHVVMSALAVPLILLSFFLSLSGRFPLHRRVSRYTFPIWMYVSVTGVLVFAMLKLFNHA
jgi:putative membrane protein